MSEKGLSGVKTGKGRLITKFPAKKNNPHKMLIQPAWAKDFKDQFLNPIIKWAMLK